MIKVLYGITDANKHKVSDWNGVKSVPMVWWTAAVHQNKYFQEHYHTYSNIRWGVEIHSKGDQSA